MIFRKKIGYVFFYNGWATLIPIDEVIKMLEEKINGLWSGAKKMILAGTIALSTIFGGKAYAEEPKEAEVVVLPGNYALRSGNLFSEEIGLELALGDDFYLRPFNEIAYLRMDDLHSVGIGFDLNYLVARGIKPYLRAEVTAVPDQSKNDYQKMLLDFGKQKDYLTAAEAGAGIRFEFDLGKGVTLGFEFGRSYNSEIGPIGETAIYLKL